MRKYLGTLVLVALFAAALLVLPSHRQADAGVSCSVPFNLTNGTTADASQVMANYNAILACLLNNTAASGANNDITSLSGLTTPLSPAQGGSAYFIGGTSVGTNTVTLANPSPNGFAYTAGYVVTFIAGGTNTGAVTLNVNSLGAKTVNKQTLAGPAALTGSEVQSGQLIAAYYDGTNFEIVAPITPIAIANISQTAPPYGYDQPINLRLNATVGSNLLTVAVKAADTGNDPSATDPVLIPFRDVTPANGDPVWVAITGALSINTNAIGATLGCQNAVPCRFWVEGFYNAGAVVLALWQSGAGSASPSINPMNESVLVTTVAMSGGATSAGVFYTPNGTTLTSQPFRILGFVETTEATAGTYATAPSKVQLFGPGVKKPGDVVQTVYSTTTSTTSFSGSGVANKTALSLTGSITPTSSANLVKAAAYGIAQVGNASANANDTATTQLYRGTGTTAIGSLSVGSPGAGIQYFATFTNFALDNPGSSSSVQYGLYGWNATGTQTNIWLATNNSVGTNAGVMTLEEIMGSLEPANDNFTPLSAVG